MSSVHWVDILVVVLYLLASLGVGPLFSAKAGKSTTSFFLGGRSLPWYLSGTSMVATTFSAGTPLLISEAHGHAYEHENMPRCSLCRTCRSLVDTHQTLTHTLEHAHTRTLTHTCARTHAHARTHTHAAGFVWEYGVYMNWWWWSFLSSNFVTTVYFARLWRRSRVQTDIEFIELRYGGRPAALVRGGRAIYFGMLVNSFVLAWLLFRYAKHFMHPPTCSTWNVSSACQRSPGVHQTKANPPHCHDAAPTE
jgi:hypothetical protein